jgi:UDP-2,3-diacylglucosamine pyrophosphatase LpxH
MSAGKACASPRKPDCPSIGRRNCATAELHSDLPDIPRVICHGDEVETTEASLRLNDYLTDFTYQTLRSQQAAQRSCRWSWTAATSRSAGSSSRRPTSSVRRCSR